MMLHILRISQDSFPHDCIEVLEEALCLLTMPFENLLSYKRAFNNPEFHLHVEKYPTSTVGSLTSLRKLQYLGSVWTDDLD